MGGGGRRFSNDRGREEGELRSRPGLTGLVTQGPSSHADFAQRSLIGGGGMGRGRSCAGCTGRALERFKPPAAPEAAPTPTLLATSACRRQQANGEGRLRD